ncbi:MAG TPA: carbonic anhydrase [Miltoncostaeaceae bacterium]|nr:carbonic anhydrase [Miltoncostaeaceae bacterium]
MSEMDLFLGGAWDHGPRHSGPDGRPRKALAILACMDARLDPLRLLGLAAGDAHVLRNAGGVVTSDVLEGLAMSQRRLGTRGVRVIHHTDCGGLAERAPMQSPEASVRSAVRILRAAPDLPHRDDVRGYVLDVESGSLAEVLTPRAAPPPASARRPGSAPSAPEPALPRCRWCKRAFDPATSSRRRARRAYCSDLCRLAARSGRPAQR